MNIALIAATIVVLFAKVLSPTPMLEEGITPTPPPNSPLPSTEATPITEKPISTNGWEYPGATIQKTGELIVMSSSDDPGKITDWYNTKIKDEGFNVTSSIKTSANDNIKNVLSAAKSGSSIKIQITQSPGQNAQIEMDLNEY